MSNMIKKLLKKTIIQPEKLVFMGLKAKGFESHFETVSGCQIHYIVKRGNPDLPWYVFVHGYSANAVHWNEVLVKVARSGHTVLALDMPGHGFSQEHPESLSFESLYQSVVGLVTKIVPSKFFVVGNSLGGAITLRLAGEHGHLLHGAVVISPAGKFDSQEEWTAFRKNLEIKTFKQAKEFLNKIYHAPPWYVPLLVPMVIRNIGRVGIGQLLDSVDVNEYDKHSKSFSVPTLLIWGQEEKLLPKKQLEYFKMHLPESVKIEEPPLVGHCPQLDNPGWLATRLLTFFESKNLAAHQKHSQKANQQQKQI